MKIIHAAALAMMLLIPLSHADIFASPNLRLNATQGVLLSNNGLAFLFVNTSGGKVSFGTTAAGELTNINGNISFASGSKIMDDLGQLKLQASGTGAGINGTGSIYFVSSTGNIKARIDTANQTGSSNYATLFVGRSVLSSGDLAEYYMTNDVSIEAGDVVSLSHYPNSDFGALIRKSIFHDKGIVGVISTEPGLVIGNDEAIDANFRMLALAGRVPVKVNNENGPIEIGDLLTSSSTPGVAMKALGPSYVIGRALEDFSGQSGTIPIIVNVQEGNIVEWISDVQTRIDKLITQNREMLSRLAFILPKYSTLGEKDNE